MTLSFFLIDKPTDWTSHDVVAFLRGRLKVKKIGHAGTLDPFATGLLIVAVGRESTKKLDTFKSMNKTYVATLRLGATSDTGDLTGAITPISAAIPTKNDIEHVLPSFLGEQDQIPPMYSAKKIGGQKLYALARKGETIERAPSRITIHAIRLLEYAYPDVIFEVVCSTGTYIRTLCGDIGAALDVGAYCNELRRTRIGEYRVEDAIPPEQVQRNDR
ncbi:MAG: tRNA pseudouridine(55) synthase TruB [Candidatus Magasanikbacteria bacterium CG10_big_fil_rev_8_21_14_0_10_47_10]|uniref:tRNA pseudouridine synthase B n=1 Tax=Candidatus Magasanikbacteria bacterium CG10_big_fil_rev_8_21_14_0_10_47_10 TaxID=1974652 RepID=A0A2H0TRF0_9BACT|nr:MAG: tRNA pseudouridine(55) synthase TruB [Candidatus Magasanikbacteria bacterium CG10_big_fil_rev_8_21_14_0_10_47_10]